MNVLVTGAAGFIGMHLSKRLIEEGYHVIGIDSLNPYYSVNLKNDRIENIGKINFDFYQIDLCDYQKLEDIFKSHQIEKVFNLAAQAGVRYSLENPHAYVQSNLVGFFNILELSKIFRVKHFLFASTSSVYGLNKSLPFQEDFDTDHPLTLYAASKKSNEVIAHSYSYLFDLPVSGFRFFTVYGPWGRPDMALFKFTKAILDGKPLDLFNHGDMIRDFTYVDDIVEGIYLASTKTPDRNDSFDFNNPPSSDSPSRYKIFNLGNSKPVQLIDYVKAIEANLGKKAKINNLPMQMGDVYATHASIEKISNWVNFSSGVSIEEGIKRFVDWYRSYYEV